MAEVTIVMDNIGLETLANLFLFAVYVMLRLDKKFVSCYNIYILNRHKTGCNCADCFYWLSALPPDSLDLCRLFLLAISATSILCIFVQTVFIGYPCCK